ncbi:hypothetical protein SUGI_0444960 [Cryptomeria japonica]|nr:hypothetical protein SUGI_0444960 [Cryptomeria japonica]
MLFRKLERSSQTPPGWRLATVKEAQDNRDSIRHLLAKWDRVRLLDGWIGGEGYYFKLQEGFRPCLGRMLVVESPTPQISDADDRKALLYSDVPELSEEGRSAAFLLCCEDWNEEVLHWLLPGLDIRAIHKDDQTKAASEVVSAIAREWQGVHAKSRRREWEFSLEVFKESLNALVVDTEKYLRGLIKNGNSEQGNNIDEILQELIRESGLTEDYEIFQDFGLEVVAKEVWYAVVENMAWQTFYILCSRLYGKVVMHSDPSLTDLIHYAYSFLGKTQKEVTAAAKEADPDFKRFDEILRFPLFSCKGKPDVLSACLLRVAEKGDVDLVKWLMERGVQPSATDDKDGRTALHHAAILSDEFNGLEIAEILIKEDETLAKAVGSYKQTPLHEAVHKVHPTMCALLLHHNASLTAKDHFGRTPLHNAMRDGRSREVVGVLVSAGGEDSNEGSARLVDVEDNQGKTPLDYALVVDKDHNASMVAWLLSLSSKPKAYFEKLEKPLSVYLRESSRMGHVDLVQNLLDAGADPFEGDDERKTSLHYAAEGADKVVAWKIIRKLLFDEKQGSINWGKASAGDKYGRNVLHVAAFLGWRRACRLLVQGNRNLIDSKDRDGQSAVYYAVAGAHDDANVLNYLFENKEAINHVLAKDFSQITPLHVAAAKGNLNMVKALLSLIRAEERKEYVGEPDVLGQTALHKAASGSHAEVVKKFLEEGANPLKERDCDGKTALHFAAQANDEQAVKIAEMIWKIKKRELEETIEAENPLRVAATLGDTDMTLECLTRGANIALIRNKEWIETLATEDEKKNVQYVLSQIKTIVEQGTDKPALEDNLGRSPFAIGLVALFLNPLVKCPVTVGIAGERGMGKSRVMVQTEKILLKVAAQLSFRSSSFQNNNLVGAGESKLSITGQVK